MPARPTIDLNCDMGERPGADGVAADERLMEFVTSVNIACGGHAGDEETAAAVMGAAAARRLSIGAHPGYADRANFGRVSVAMTADELEAMIAEQLRWFTRIASRAGCVVTHVKPHGALYHDVMEREDAAGAFMRAVRSLDGAWGGQAGRVPVLVGLFGSTRPARWRAEGFAVAAEAFADRRYRADGGLVARSEAWAVIADPGEAAEQAVDIAVHRCAAAAGGVLVPVIADTICVHSDSPGAEGTARRVREALEHEGCGLRGLGG